MVVFLLLWRKKRQRREAAASAANRTDPYSSDKAKFNRRYQRNRKTAPHGELEGHGLAELPTLQPELDGGLPTLAPELDGGLPTRQPELDR